MPESSLSIWIDKVLENAVYDFGAHRDGVRSCAVVCHVLLCLGLLLL